MIGKAWNHPHQGELPNDNRAVNILVSLRDGTFKPDIGRYWGKEEGWSTQFWGDAPVIAWSDIPDFADTEKLIELAATPQ